MKGFILRLALLIHWFGFLALAYIPFFIILILSGEAIAGEELLMGFAVPPAIAFFFWVLKWLISGNKSIFPWQS